MNDIIHTKTYTNLPATKTHIWVEFVVNWFNRSWDITMMTDRQTDRRASTHARTHTHKPSNEHTCPNWNFWQVTRTRGCSHFNPKLENSFGALYECNVLKQPCPYLISLWRLACHLYGHVTPASTCRWDPKLVICTEMKIWSFGWNFCHWLRRFSLKWQHSRSGTLASPCWRDFYCKVRQHIYNNYNVIFDNFESSFVDQPTLSKLTDKISQDVVVQCISRLSTGKISFSDNDHTTVAID